MPDNSEIGTLSLPLEQIAAPAFFVDKKLSVRWMAPSGTDAFSQVLARELKGTSTRNVFDIVLRDEIKRGIPHWHVFFSFLYTLLKRTVPQDIFDMGTIFVPKANIPDDHDHPSPLAEFGPFQVETRLLANGSASGTPPLRLYGLEFNSGTLFLLRDDDWQAAGKCEASLESARTGQQPADQKKIIAILSARLNDSHRIAETMLPELYFELTDHLWAETDDAVRSFGGKRIFYDGGEIQYRFSDSIGRNPVFSAICCATRLNGRMRAVTAKLAAKRGWMDEIHLNMGISHGTDDETAAQSSDPLELLIPGGASDQASVLSGISAMGEIWITKHAVTQLPKNLLNQVVLGVNRNGQFFRNFFTRFSDLRPKSGYTDDKPDLAALAIARIENMQPEAA